MRRLNKMTGPQRLATRRYPLCAAVLLVGLVSGFISVAHAADDVVTPAVANTAPLNEQKVITHDVYANWKSVQGSTLSRDGQWAAYGLVAQEADGELLVKNLSDKREWRTPRGTAPVFSADGRYLAFAIQPTRAEIDKAKKDKKKADDMPKPGVGLMDLATGKVESVAKIKRFAWAEEGGNYLAVLSEPPKDSKAKKDSDNSAKKKELGAEFILIDAATGKRSTYQGVTDFSWNKKGTLLAFSVKQDEAAAKTSDKPMKKEDGATDNDAGKNPVVAGVYLVNPQDAQTRAILSGAGSYKHLQFDKAGKQLAFVSDRDDIAQKQAKAQAEMKADTKADLKEETKTDAHSDDKPGIYQLYYWRDGDIAAKVIVSADTSGMPAGWAPSEFAELKFSKDGERLFLGTAELPKAEARDAPEIVKVDLWHWKDPELQSMQKVKAEKEKQRSYQAVFHVAKQTFVQLATPAMPGVVINDNARFALGSSDLPYRMLQSWDALYYDIYAVDLQTGKARILQSKSRFAASLSPAGKYALLFDADRSQWLVFSMADGEKKNLTSKLSVRFEDRKRDTPEPKPAYGFAGWTADDASVVLYDQYDLWDINPSTLLSRNLTAGYGRKNHLELRYVDLSSKKKTIAEDPTPEAERKALPETSWILAATHEDSRATGYFQQNPKGGLPVKLIYGNKLITGLQKAKKADTVLFTQQSFTEFPDLWSSNLQLQTPQKLSAANPQQAQYNWGTQELITYTAANGKKLKALLAKPENFDPAKKYPMMVYIYENMSDNLYRYIPPAPAQNINVTRYVSNGYIVLRPDIEYETGHPGKSAMNTVLPAIQQVIAKGYVDPKRVGIQGHSWGAYQVNYLISHSNIFRAAEAGASMADMISGYGGIRWGTGMSRAFQYEHGQSRIGASPWDRPDLYIENSPIFAVKNVHTPYLTIHNDDDDAVPYYQAIEFFTALRQLGKEAYWFNYNGEKHGLKDRDHMKHFTVHMAEFFDHYLLDQARPDWMDTPVPYLQRGKRDVMGKFKPAENIKQEASVK